MNEDLDRKPHWMKAAASATKSRFKYQEPREISMCEVLERRIITQDIPYDLEEPSDEREITRGLMRLSQQALYKYVDNEPDIY